MAQSVSRSEQSYVVGTPRASDAIGCALRDAYSREPLPQDMMMLLGKLNHLPDHRSHG